MSASRSLEGRALEDGLGLLKPVHLRLAVLQPDVKVDRDEVAARGNALEERQRAGQAALVGRALALLSAHRRLVRRDLPLELTLARVQRRDGRRNVRAERVVLGDGGVLVRGRLADVLLDVLLDELHDGNDAVALALGATVPGVPRRRRRGRRLTSRDEGLLLLEQREALVLVETREHADRGLDQADRRLVVLLVR